MIQGKNRLKIFVLVLCSLFFPISIFCETLKLKNGKVINSKIIKKTEKAVQMNIDGMAITYYLDEIESIDGKVLAIPKIEEKTINTTETTRIQLPPIEIIEVEYKLSPEVKDYIKAEIIMLWQFYRNQFDFEYPQDSAIKVRIFGNLDTFEEYQISLRGKVLSRAGVFWHKTKEVAVWKNKNQGTMIDMIIHEVSHFLLYLQYNKFPKWISEGLSVFFEGMRISKDNI